MGKCLVYLIYFCGYKTEIYLLAIRFHLCSRHSIACWRYRFVCMLLLPLMPVCVCACDFLVLFRPRFVLCPNDGIFSLVQIDRSISVWLFACFCIYFFILFVCLAGSFFCIWLVSFRCVCASIWFVFLGINRIVCILLLQVKRISKINSNCIVSVFIISCAVSVWIVVFFFCCSFSLHRLCRLLCDILFFSLVAVFIQIALYSSRSLFTFWSYLEKYHLHCITLHFRDGLVSILAIVFLVSYSHTSLPRSLSLSLPLISPLRSLDFHWKYFHIANWHIRLRQSCGFFL